MEQPFKNYNGAVSPSSRRAWIEIFPGRQTRRLPSSPSSRRAWIEIPSYWSKATEAPVALLAEGVDRNNNKAIPDLMKMVALLAEGVDRNNNIRKILAMLDKVALLAEGVDRNLE